MSLIVIDPGLSTTIQDSGRLGYREWGVPLGGAFDRGSADLANTLLGNPSGCAALEITLVGGQYQADCPMALALAGAPLEATVVGPNATRVSVQVPSSFSVMEGDKLVLGRTMKGSRTYLAVSGGWQTSLHLGSHSSEERLKAGEMLPSASGTVAARRPGEPGWRSASDDPFRIIAGPDGRFHPELDDRFWSARRFQVGSQSNRMGLRLQGDPVTIASPPDRLSTPVAPGAVQVAGGQLIVLGVACGTMGGYPHVAHVISADVDRLGQLRPGDTISFRCVSLEEARSIDQAERQMRWALLRRLATLVNGD
jgi:biotin-dependent carboxylase-like uncharacterized protein